MLNRSREELQRSGEWVVATVLHLVVATVLRLSLARVVRLLSLVSLATFSHLREVSVFCFCAD